MESQIQRKLGNIAIRKNAYLATSPSCVNGRWNPMLAQRTYGQPVELVVPERRGREYELIRS